MDNEIKFSYPKYVEYGSYLLSLVCIIVFGRILFKLTQNLFLLILDNRLNSPFVFLYLFQIILLPTIATSAINFFQKFTISDEGIEFQVFILWRKFIPWTDIISMRKASMSWAKEYVIITKRLTFFHRIMGLLYGFTLSPAFVFNGYLSHYDEAVEVIQQRLNQM